MTELTNAQLHQIREALRISLEYLPDNDDLTTVNTALGIVDRLLDVSTVVIASKEVPAAKVETAPKHSLG